MLRESGKCLQRQVQSLACFCAKAVRTSRCSLRGHHLVFPAGKAGEQGWERCPVGWYRSWALLHPQNRVWERSLCFGWSGFGGTCRWRSCCFPLPFVAVVGGCVVLIFGVSSLAVTSSCWILLCHPLPDWRAFRYPLVSSPESA